MPFYKIYAGLGGGFGGAQYQYTEEFSDEDAAMDDAYLKAFEEYESYGGLHGLLTDEEATEMALEDWEDYDPNNEAHVDELINIKAEIFREDAENWIDYYVEETENLDDDDENYSE